MRNRDESKIDKFFEACLDIVFEDGLVGITMNKVAKTAGLSIGALYTYFDSKELLLENLFILIKKKSSAQYFENLSYDGDFRILLKTVWRNILKHRLDFYRESIFIEQYYHSKYMTSDIKLKTDIMIQPLFDIIKKGIKESEIKDMDYLTIATYLIGPIAQLAELSRTGVKPITDTSIEETFGLIWQGLKA